jgi:hypothetical protein
VALARLMGVLGPWRAVVDALVICGVPAAPCACPGDAGSCRASTGAESKGGGDAGPWASSRSGASRAGAMRALARPGHAWACLGTSMPACARVVLVKGVHGRVQGGERERPDMVVWC